MEGGEGGGVFKQQKHLPPSYLLDTLPFPWELFSLPATTAVRVTFRPVSRRHRDRTVLETLGGGGGGGVRGPPNVMEIKRVASSAPPRLANVLWRRRTEAEIRGAHEMRTAGARYVVAVENLVKKIDCRYCTKENNVPLLYFKTCLDRLKFAKRLKKLQNVVLKMYFYSYTWNVFINHIRRWIRAIYIWKLGKCLAVRLALGPLGTHSHYAQITCTNSGTVWGGGY